MGIYTYTYAYMVYALMNIGQRNSSENFARIKSIQNGQMNASCMCALELAKNYKRSPKR